MSFELTTWPDYLCYSGDMGTYVFRRLTDMFEFFRTALRDDGQLRINPAYWSEKLEAVDPAGVEEFSPRLFTEKVTYAVSEDCTGTPPSQELLEAVKDEVLSHADDGLVAVRAAIDFKFEGARPFEDFWEVNVSEYTTRFLWCCFAIAWGIRQYDSVSA